MTPRCVSTGTKIIQAVMLPSSMLPLSTFGGSALLDYFTAASF